MTGEEFDKLKMCLTCVDLLDSAYLFQSICTKTEQQLVKEATQVETIQIKQEKPDEFMQLWVISLFWASFYTYMTMAAMIVFIGNLFWLFINVFQLLIVYRIFLNVLFTL